MAAATREAATTETQTEKGVSLARGPALILGTILLAAGLYALYKEHTFPPFSNFPNGHAPVEGKVFGLFGANGWTGMLTAVAGGLLLFGAAQHLLAKTMSLIVGIGLGAAAVIALISGDVLGMAAANHLTELAWGIAAAILLFNTLIPRRRRKVEVADGTAAAAGDGAAAGYGARRRAVSPAADGRLADDRADTRVANDGAETRVADDRADTRVADDRADTRVAHDGAETRPSRDGAADPRVADDEADTRVGAGQRERPANDTGGPAA
jgi:hypothetical protein